jgi:hypothetical protein
LLLIWGYFLDNPWAVEEITKEGEMMKQESEHFICGV